VEQSRDHAVRADFRDHIQLRIPLDESHIRA
jgi:hypothetical protein